MPRPTQRRMLLEHILETIKHFTWLMKELPEDDMILRLLDELLGVYQEVSARRYIAVRGISAGRHEEPREISILENLIKNYPETAFLECIGLPSGYLWISSLQCGLQNQRQRTQLVRSAARGFLPVGSHYLMLKMS